MKKNLLITGCSSGFGNALMKTLYKEYNIISLSRRKPKNLKSMKVDHYSIDLSDLKKLDNTLTKIVKKYKFIPFLVNNAASFEVMKIDELTNKKIIKSFSLNSFAPVLIIKKILPQMKKKKFGRIVNITSGAPINCSPNVSLYNASKAALNAFSITASKELKKFNIKVNLFSPGQIKTEMMPMAKGDPFNSVAKLKFLLNENKNLITGKFVWTKFIIPLMPDLKGIDWSKNKAPKKTKIIKYD